MQYIKTRDKAIVELYLKGISLHEIAEKFKMKPESIRSILKKEGFTNMNEY